MNEEALRTALAARRECGGPGFDPVRLRFIEALLQGAGRHQGLARQLLHDKARRLLAVDEAAAGKGPEAAAGAADPTPGPGPLAALLGQLARHADATAPGELRAAREFRATWARLSANQRLTQSQAQVPENAGPLNSQHLVHRALTLMRDLSPEYLNRFIAQVDALLWLEQAIESAPPRLRDKRPAGRT
jgi:hypothetical protein